MRHLGTKKLQTERLILRRFTSDDYKDMFNNWASDSTVSRYLPWNAHKDEKETQALLQKWVEEYKNADNYNWCIEYEGRAIGNIGVVAFDKNTKTAKTAYCIGTSFWGKGIVTEGYKAVLEFLFCKVGISKISTSHDIRNIGSGRVMEKCGLKEVRTEKQTLKDENIVVSIKEITKEEFLSQNP